MLDMKFLRNHFEEVKGKLVHRGEELSALDQFGELDARRRELIAETEQLKAKRNEASKQISLLKREQKDADDAIKEMRTVSDQIKVFDKELTFTGTGKITIYTSLTNGGTNWWTLTKNLTFQGPDISVEWIMHQNIFFLFSISEWELRRLSSEENIPLFR